MNKYRKQMCPSHTPPWPTAGRPSLLPRQAHYQLYSLQVFCCLQFQIHRSHHQWSPRHQKVHLGSLRIKVSILKHTCPDIKSIGTYTTCSGQCMRWGSGGPRAQRQSQGTEQAESERPILPANQKLITLSVQDAPTKKGAPGSEIMSA